MNRMKFPLLRMLVALSAVALLASCASDQQMGLCTTLGMCNEDPEEVKEKADKKWWCEYYSGKKL